MNKHLELAEVISEHKPDIIVLIEIKTEAWHQNIMNEKFKAMTTILTLTDGKEGELCYKTYSPKYMCKGNSFEESL